MKDRYLATPYGLLCYRIEKGSERTVLFLHGGGGSSSAWDIIRPYLNTIPNEKLFLDLRGHGKSFRPDNWREYNLEEHAKDIFALINKLNIKRCIVVGHCLGSMVATTFATQHPERVEKLILINPGINRGTIFFNRFIQLTYSALNACTELLEIKSISPSKHRVDYTQFRNSHDFSPKRLWTDLYHTGLRTAISQSKAFFHWNYEKVYKSIITPTCIIGGTHDIIFNRFVLEKIMHLIPESQLTFINSGHISVITHPKEVAEKIKLFLR